MSRVESAGQGKCCFDMAWQEATQVSFKILARDFCPPIEEFLGRLHTCRKERDLVQILHVHACMCEYGLEMQTSLGNYLVSLLVGIGSVHHAQQVFDKQLHRDANSWDSLITHYTNHGEPQKAILLYKEMREDVPLQPCVFVALLRSCITLMNMERGCQIHADIARRGLLEEDRFLAAAVIDMYAKCGAVEKAQEVFHTSQFRNTVMWNTLISAHIEHGQGEEALLCFEAMQEDKVTLDATTIVFVLKLCGMIGHVSKGYETHAEIVERGWLEGNVFIASALVGMYGKCGLLSESQEVFDRLPIQNEVSWITLIAGLVEHGCSEEALSYHRRMQDEGIPSHPATLICSLKACGCVGAIKHGQELHSEIVKRGLEKDTIIGNTLIDMYSKCGLLLEAQQVFDKLVNRTLVSWTALISGYVEFGYGEIALHSLEQMQLQHITPDAATFICSLKACGSLEAVATGQEIHIDVVKKGFSDSDEFVGVTLVHMYAKCGALEEAQKVFADLTERSVVAWNTLIAGYAERGCSKEALECFEQMVHEGMLVDSATVVYCLNACGKVQNSVKGQEIHDIVIKRGAEEDELLGNTLVDMYAECGLLTEAHEVLIKLPYQTATSWTPLIAGYVDQGHSEEALRCFTQAQSEGMSCNSVIHVCTLKACSLIAALGMGREIHALIVKQGVLEKDVLVASALVSLYAKHGLIEEGRKVLKELTVRDLISWTALIRGCVDYGHYEEALCCFKEMLQEGTSPDCVAFVCSLSACSSIGAAVLGLRMHGEINLIGLETELVIGNAVVDMYAKCGCLAAAHIVFDKLPLRDVISWNALLTGYAQFGQSERVFYLVDRMREDGAKLDMYTFVSVLNVCSHVGLLETSQMCFRTLMEANDLVPSFEHFTCMVDLFARAGCIANAVALIKQMPCHPDLVIWHALLGASRMHGYLELGSHAFKHAVQMNERDATAYVSMSNLFFPVNTTIQSVQHGFIGGSPALVS